MCSQPPEDYALVLLSRESSHAWDCVSAGGLSCACAMLRRMRCVDDLLICHRSEVSDFRTKHFIDKDYYSEMHTTFRAASEKVLQIKKGPDDMEKFRNILWQNNIEHKSEQYRNERKVITHEIFEVKCDFRVACKGDRRRNLPKLRHWSIGFLVFL